MATSNTRKPSRESSNPPNATNRPSGDQAGSKPRSPGVGQAATVWPVAQFRMSSRPDKGCLALPITGFKVRAPFEQKGRNFDLSAPGVSVERTCTQRDTCGLLGFPQHFAGVSGGCFEERAGAFGGRQQALHFLAEARIAGTGPVEIRRPRAEICQCERGGEHFIGREGRRHSVVSLPVCRQGRRFLRVSIFSVGPSIAPVPTRNAQHGARTDQESPVGLRGCSNSRKSHARA